MTLCCSAAVRVPPARAGRARLDPAARAGATSRREQWESAQWQRVNCVKNIKQLRAVLGDLVDERFYADLAADQARFATMSMLVPPQMINTMVPEPASVRRTRGPTRSTPTRSAAT